VRAAGGDIARRNARLTATRIPTDDLSFRQCGRSRSRNAVNTETRAEFFSDARVRPRQSIPRESRLPRRKEYSRARACDPRCDALKCACSGFKHERLLCRSSPQLSVACQRGHARGVTHVRARRRGDAVADVADVRRDRAPSLIMQKELRGNGRV